MLSVCNTYGKFTSPPEKSKFYIIFFLTPYFILQKVKNVDINLQVHFP